MPVSKKRKKDGKSVQRKVATPANPEHSHGPASGPEAPLAVHAHGKPTNPFVAQQQSRRGAQRGR